MLNLTPFLRRTFATTSRYLVGPESPSFIEVPSAKLPRVIPPPRPKGILPVPRNIFRPSQPGKGKAKYLCRVVLEPYRRRAKPTDAQSKAIMEWQAKMAAKRRDNLREGLAGLRQRKESAEKRRRRMLLERGRERDAVLAKAEREDVRLTLPSVLSTLRLQGKGLPDPNREERLKAMAARQEQALLAKKQERQQMLHELYITAGDFILTEVDLDKAIDENFREFSPSQRFITKTKPPTVRELLSQKERDSQGDTLTSGIMEEVSAVLEVGGALTGGRIPPNKFYQGKGKAVGL